MAMMRYSSATVVEPCVKPEQWEKSINHRLVACDDKNCRVKTAKTILAKYSPQKYLLSHCTIIAAVDTELANPSDPKSDYYIHPAYSKFINNNGDAWSKAMLASCYRSFVGANNFLEHIQINELSKGKVIDAILREVPIGKDKTGKDLTTYYVDILVATEKKHKDLIRRIEAKELSTLSMGCFISGTEITIADGTKRNIEEIQPGDMVITHTGKVKPVMHVQKRWHDDIVHAVKIEGDYKTTYVTSEHPFWAFNKGHSCACGCGEKINVKIRGDKIKGGVPFHSRFKVGHYARIINPNKNIYSLDQYRELKNNNSMTEKMSLSWIEAKDLKVGDIVSYPVSKVIIESEDATVEKARLIGYFLAEGSFVKEVVVEGKGNDYGVRCRICGGIYNKISTHLLAHKMKQKEYLELFPDAPINAKKHKKLIRTKSRLDNLGVKDLIRTRKKTGVEFSLGEHEKDTLNKEISELLNIVFPNATILRYDKCIKIIGKEVAEFFEKYGGEYFNEKVLPQEVLYWEPSIQRHLVSTWIIGDLNTTGSKNLADQLHFLFNRLHVIHNNFKVEKRAYKTDLKKMTADGTIVTQHYEGIRSEAYMIQINHQGFETLKKELNNAFKFRYPSRYKNVSDWANHRIKRNWRNSHSLDSILRPIKETVEIPYQGWVYNFSVKDDESYIANDIAVHNCKIAYSICSKCGKKAVDETEACQHVRFEKNNMFYDDNGVQRKVGELCGHASEPESVTFIDASWVANPAFTGAVIRNIVNPPENIMAKLEEAQKKDSYIVKDGDFLKAAHKRAQDEDEPAEKDEEPPKEEDTKDEPAGAEEPALEVNAAPGEEEGAPEETPTPETSTPEAPAPEPESPVKTWKKDIKKKLLDELSNDLVKEFTEGTESPTNELETLDESLVQPTASSALRKMWLFKRGWENYLRKTAKNMDRKNFDRLRFGTYMILTSKDLTALANYGFNRRDFLAVMSYLDKNFKRSLSLGIKKAVADLNGTENLTLREAVYALQKLSSRRLSEGEIKKALTWLKAMDFYPE